MWAISNKVEYYIGYVHNTILHLVVVTNNNIINCAPTQMDIQDFQGLTKYKFVLPTFYVFSWICMLLGPTLFETTYARICVFIFVYTDIKIVLFFINMIIINVKAHRIFQKHANKEEPIEIVDMGNQERIDTSQ